VATMSLCAVVFMVPLRPFLTTRQKC
jgi:hypothetical protein